MSEFAMDLTAAEEMVEKYSKVVEATAEIAQLTQENATTAAGIFEAGSFKDHIGGELNRFAIKTRDYAATANVMYQFMLETHKTVIDTDKLIAKSVFDQFMSEEPADEQAAQIQQYMRENPEEASKKLYETIKENSEGE